MSHEVIPGRATNPDPISIGIARRVKSDQIEAFEAWLGEIQAAAVGFDGYSGMDVVRASRR